MIGAHFQGIAISSRMHFGAFANAVDRTFDLSSAASIAAKAIGNGRPSHHGSAR